jgi:CubicO group peptidase (beta-lactamase class C family)
MTPSDAPLARTSAVPAAVWDAAAARVLRQRLDRWVESGRVAGLQYLVVHAGEGTFEHCAGVADADSGAPVCSGTQFNLYSITKPFTATAVAHLALQGAIAPDEPIARAAAQPALAGLGTVHETLLHRAGFANPLPLRWTHRAEDDARFDEPAFVQRRLDEAAARRRGRARYSNIGYLALGRAVERVTGLGFREALQRTVLDPLHLGPGEHLGFGPAAGAAWSPGHLNRHGALNLLLGAFVRRRDVVAGTSGRWVRLHRHHVDGSAYGGLIGNARGLARFGQALLGQGACFDTALRHLACDAQPGPGDGRSLAWFTGQLAGQPWLGHAGGGLGAYGELRLYPRLGRVSVLLTNRPGLRDARALDRLDAAWLRSTAHA